MHGLDYSWARPSPQHLAAAGVKYAFRYVAHDAGKSLTGAEAQALRAVGIAVAPNFEDGATNALKGSAQGVADANFANDELDKMGCPPDVIVWYSVDTAASADQVRAYFQGVHHAVRRPAGCYGGLQVGRQLRSEKLVVGVWCANAASWSGYGNWQQMADAARSTGGADVLQHLDHPLVQIDPLSYDYDEVLRPIAAWGSTPPTVKDSPMAIHPRRIKPTAAWPLPAVVVTPKGDAVGGFHGVTFAASAGFAVSTDGVNAGLTASYDAPVTVAESVKGDGIIFTDHHGDEFFLKYGGTLLPDPWRVAAPAPADLNVLAKAVAEHLKITAG